MNPTVKILALHRTILTGAARVAALRKRPQSDMVSPSAESGRKAGVSRFRKTVVCLRVQDHGTIVLARSQSKNH